MLLSLNIHNFALIEDVQLEFEKGFNVFTGETGAGKSILIDAFGILLGNRSSIEYLRKGTNSYWIQAVFDIGNLKELKLYLDSVGIDIEDDTLYLKRRVLASGKSQALVNGVQTPINIIKKISHYLVDIHGQHQNHALLRPDSPLKIIDLYIADEIKQDLSNFQDVYIKYNEKKLELENLLKQNESRTRNLDSLTWEINEIESVKLKLDEESELKLKSKKYSNSNKIMESLREAYNNLNGNDIDNSGVLDVLNTVKYNVENILKYDDSFKETYKIIETAWINLEDARQNLGNCISENNFNPRDLECIQERLDIIYRMKKKYGSDIQEILNYCELAKRKRNNLYIIDKTISEKEKEVNVLKEKLDNTSDILSRKRKKYAIDFSNRVKMHINDLAMKNAEFSAVFKKKDSCTFNGMDEVTFYFNANVGQDAKPLEKIASGGELSRLALAMKTVLLEKNHVPTMIFDEIDAGIGGITAEKMAEKITIISEYRQVLCITHLAQIAVFADNHIYIEKIVEDGMTKTKLHKLENVGIVDEITRMSLGSANTKIAKDNAKQLLKRASTIKKGLRSLEDK